MSFIRALYEVRALMLAVSFRYQPDPSSGLKAASATDELAMGAVTWKGSSATFSDHSSLTALMRTIIEHGVPAWTSTKSLAKRTEILGL